MHNIFARKFVVLEKIMKQEELQSTFEYYVQQINGLSTIDNFYDYEKKFVELHNALGKEMLEKSLEQRATLARKKNFKPDLE